MFCSQVKSPGGLWVGKKHDYRNHDNRLAPPWAIRKAAANDLCETGRRRDRRCATAPFGRTLDLGSIAFEGSDSLDNPTAVFQ